MNNLDIRLIVDNSKLTYRQIAKQIGITPEYLSGRMSKPLEQKMRERILTAIHDLTVSRETSQESR